MNFETPYSCWCSVECSSPLGLQDRSIPDSALTASSAEANYPANRARLNNRGAWEPRSYRGAWFQVEFSNVTNITAIATQGDPTYYGWVKSYSVYHSTDGQYFQPYHPRVGNYILYFKVQRFNVHFKVDLQYAVLSSCLCDFPRQNYYLNKFVHFSSMWKSRGIGLVVPGCLKFSSGQNFIEFL